MSSPCIARLSFDLFSAILEEVVDSNTLSALSLTSSALRIDAQKRLFYKFAITVGSITHGSGYADNMMRLTEFLASNPSIARSIRVLTIRVLEDFDGVSRAFHWPTSRTLLSAFSSVRQLSIVDVSRSRYRAWWDMRGGFGNALRGLMHQNSVEVLQLGAPGFEREFEWPHEEYRGPPVYQAPPPTNDMGGQLRYLRAAVFRDRPDNLGAVQGVLKHAALTLTDLWLVFPSHSLPCNSIVAALSLQDLTILKGLTLTFSSESLIRPVLQILDTLSEETHGDLKLTVFMRRSSYSAPSIIAAECWRDLDSKFSDILDRRIIRNLEMRITVFEMSGTFREAVKALTELLPGVSRQGCLAFDKK